MRIRPEIDTARYGHTIPISAAATEALDNRTLLQRAGADAGLSKHDAAHLSYHDFRHAALMDLGSRITIKRARKAGRS